MLENSELMREARIDLSATIEGKFSPADWEAILNRAGMDLASGRDREPQRAPQEVWQEVVRGFHREQYWGFIPNYKAPPKPHNMGLTFIWLTFNALTIMKVAILWFGQIYTSSDDPKDKWIFFAVLFLFFGNFAYFLIRNYARPDTN